MTNILPEGSFTGLQIVDPTRDDWVRGGETGVSGQILNTSSDWRAHLPTKKIQLMIVNGVSYGDTESCTNFSATNDIATQLQFLVDTNQVPADALSFLKSNGYFDPITGKINLSARHSAITSGTTVDGNNMPKVWQTLRTVGVVPYTDCPDPVAEWEAKITSGKYSVIDLLNIWFEPSAVTQVAVAKGLAFLTHFQIQYQWVAYIGAEATPQTLLQDLQVAPLNIATAVCAGWNTADPIQGCGVGAAHATTMVFVETPTIYDILDHYVPFLKQFAANYSISYAIQGVVSPIVTTPVSYPPPANFKHTFTQQLDLGVQSAEVVAVQDALKIDGEFSQSVQSTGYFGTITQVAVEKFQVKYGIASAGVAGYGRVGPKTIAQLNALFSK